MSAPSFACRGPSIAAAVLAVVLAAGCGPTEASPPPDAVPSTGAYHFWLKLDDVAARVWVLANGFPVDETYGGRVYDNAPLAAPLTAALVSGRNTVSVRAAPYLTRSGDALGVGPVRLHGRVIRGLEGGGAVEGAEITEAAVAAAREAWALEVQALWPRWLAMEDSALAADPSLLDSLAAAAATDPAAVGSGPALEAAWAWALEHPLEVEVSFVRPGGPSPADGQPAFDAVFRGAPVVAGTAADSAALRAYAVRLRDLTAARDTAALLAEFAPAIGDNFEAVGGEAVMDRATYDARNRAAVVLGEIEPFEAEDVRLRSWSGGRVWELYRPSGPLLRRGPTVRSVYVGEVGGRLRVVRR